MIRLSFIFMVVSLSSGAIAKRPAEPAPVPQITIDFPGVIESNCKALGLKTGDAPMVAELRQRLPAWRAAWDKDGPRLLAELRRTVGKPFKFRESIAILQTCEGLHTTSYPLIIDARKSLTGGSGPRSAAQTAKSYQRTSSSGRCRANSSTTQPNSKVHRRS